MPRTTDPISTPNQYLRGDILSTASSSSSTAIPNDAISRHAAKGRSVSGRSSYRLRPQRRASSLITSNRANAKSKSWKDKEVQRRLKKEIRDMEKEVVNERIENKRLKRQRALDNERRRMENEYKNAKLGMQALNANRLGNTMRNMNKKQLRQIKKSRMNSKTGVVEFVGAYEK
ncbi:hypothetical protein ACHAW5_002330 [Stephanodiscus triporus]|uniref:Coiled-coil domain-containing protein 86 n=1 Tax=Stephanodiscus triporus TaxID=2934178 RepID=A0ABD3N2W7_9STRA